MIYARSQKTKMEIFVMPAWMAGLQIRRIRPETSMSAWIPALHAGMTQSRSCTMTDRGALRPSYFQKEHEEHKERFPQQGSSNPPLFPPLSKGDERGFLDFLMTL